MKLWQITSKSWMSNRERFFHVDTQAYCVGKHSTRSKYRGYFIEQFTFHVKSVGRKMVKKGLSKEELVTWIRLMKGE